MILAEWEVQGCSEGADLSGPDDFICSRLLNGGSGISAVRIASAYEYNPYRWGSGSWNQQGSMAKQKGAFKLCMAGVSRSLTYQCFDYTHLQWLFGHISFRVSIRKGYVAMVLGSVSKSWPIRSREAKSFRRRVRIIWVVGVRSSESCRIEVPLSTIGCSRSRGGSPAHMCLWVVMR